jgi:hypothetical protein
VFEKYMIGEVRNGEDAFDVDLLLCYYRGLRLSMVEDLRVNVDGDAVPREALRFSVNGRPYTLDEMETEYEVAWEFGAPATLRVERPGGLAAGEHTLDVTQRLRISYLPFVPERSASKVVVVP